MHSVVGLQRARSPSDDGAEGVAYWRKCLLPTLIGPSFRAQAAPELPTAANHDAPCIVTVRLWDFRDPTRELRKELLALPRVVLCRWGGVPVGARYGNVRWERPAGEYHQAAGPVVGGAVQVR